MTTQEYNSLKKTLKRHKFSPSISLNELMDMSLLEMDAIANSVVLLRNMT